MLSGVPNFAMVIGYTNASWTLRPTWSAATSAGCSSTWTTHGYAVATPVAPAGGRRPAVPRPAVGLRAAQPRRAAQAGPRTPWKLHQNYLRDVRLMRRGPLDDEGMTFQRPAPPATERAAA